MSTAIPPLSGAVRAKVERIFAMPAVQGAMKQALDEAEFAKAVQIRISEIPSPTFKEEVRAREIARLMREYGLTDVVIDPIGNVVGRRPGRLAGKGPVLALGAHMDTVFPEGTDVRVRQEGTAYYAPGQGHTASKLCSIM